MKSTGNSNKTTGDANRTEKGEKNKSGNGGPSVSKKNEDKHFKDSSGGEGARKNDEPNTTKKQGNSV